MKADTSSNTPTVSGGGVRWKDDTWLSLHGVELNFVPPTRQMRMFMFLYLMLIRDDDDNNHLIFAGASHRD